MGLSAAGIFTAARKSHLPRCHLSSGRALEWWHRWAVHFGVKYHAAAQVLIGVLIYAMRDLGKLHDKLFPIQEMWKTACRDYSVSASLAGTRLLDFERQCLT